MSIFVVDATCPRKFLNPWKYLFELYFYFYPELPEKMLKSVNTLRKTTSCMGRGYLMHMPINIVNQGGGSKK